MLGGKERNRRGFRPPPCGGQAEVEVKKELDTCLCDTTQVQHSFPERLQNAGRVQSNTQQQVSSSPGVAGRRQG